MRLINKIILHHSLTKDQQVVDFDAIKRYHINTNKWADIGYHYLIELVGNEYKILKGRDENTAGVHTSGQNANSIGICCVGNFDETVPPDAQLNKLVELIKDIYSRHGILPIHGHNEYSTKSCPGIKFPMQKVKDMVNGISQLTETVNRIGIVNANPSLNVREGAGVQFQKIGVLENGTQVKVVGQKDDWYEIEYGTGYIHKDYIKFEVQEEVKDKVQDMKKFDYELQGTTHILKVNPLDLGIVIENKAIKNISQKTAVNGTFFWQGQPNGIIINDGKILGEQSSHAWRGFPQSVIYCNKQGKVYIGRYKTASEFNVSNVAWAIGGLGIIASYGYSPNSEGFNGVYSDVLRTTAKTFMGYKSSENKIYICVRPSSSHDRIIQSCKNLGLDFAISLDGGGSSSIKVDGSVKVSGDGRAVNSYLYVK